MLDWYTKTGNGICHVFKEKSWKNAINKADYYERDFTPEIPENLAGGIRCHKLMPLQSKKKMGGNSKAYQWMADPHAALWCIGHVIENQAVHDNKKLVCVAILAVDSRLSQYTI